jgi:hypothetical protein
MARSVSKVIVKMKKTGAPTGNAWAEIHSSSAGTSLTKDTSTNIVGAASANVDIATGITTAYTSITFTFSGTKPALDENTTYYLVIYGSNTVSTTNYLSVGLDVSTPIYTNGKLWKIDGSLAWTGVTSVDMVFEIYAMQVTAGSQLLYGSKETGLYEYITHRVEDDIYHAAAAMSFKLAETTQVGSVKIPLNELFNPTANLWVEIHSSQTGTSFTKNASTNIVGQASDNVNGSVLGISPEWIEFAFSGTKPTLTAATTYYLVIYYPGTTSVIGITHQSGYPDGGYWAIDAALGWIDWTTSSLSFEIIGTVTAESKLEENALTNIDDIKSLRNTASQTLMAQSFVAGRDGTVSKLSLYLAKAGSPTGNIWVEIHESQTGTSASKNTSTFQVGQASDNVDVSTLGALPTYAFVDFTFSGTKPPLVAGQTYYIVLYGSYTVSTTAYAAVAYQSIDAAFADGNAFTVDGSLVWTSFDYLDLIFKLYYAATTIHGDYQFAVVYVRSGNYQTLGNPSETTVALHVEVGEEFSLTNIPVSTDPKVDKKWIYRTTANDAILYYLAEIANATMTYISQEQDDVLGDELEYNNDPPPKAGMMETWDGRMWYVSDEEPYTDYLYYSKTDYPECVPLLDFIPLKEREASKIIRLIVFNDHLYALKTNSVWCLIKQGEGVYEVSKVMDGLGTISPDSVQDIGGVLAFLTPKKSLAFLNSYNSPVSLDLSAKVARSLNDISTTIVERATSAVVPERSEYYLSLPMNSTAGDPVLYLDFAKQRFSIDRYGKTITALALLDKTPTEYYLTMGTQTGGLYIQDAGETDDDGASFTFDAQSGWYDSGREIVIRRIYLYFAYAVPTGETAKTFVFQVFDDFHITPALAHTVTGEVKGSTWNQRKTLVEEIGCNIRGKQFSFRVLTATVAPEFAIIKMRIGFEAKSMRGSVKVKSV